MPTATDAAPVRCPVCTETGAVPFVEKDGYPFRKCTVCGFIFCHPRPTQEELTTHYLQFGAHGYRGITPDFYPKASSRRRRGFFNALKLLPHVWGKRVLDLGCGGGFVVAGMKTVGAGEAVGVDINPNSVAYARAHFPRCTFHAGMFEEFTDGRLGTFDLVYSSEVIEHVRDVEAYMSLLASLCKPGAKAFITTPDIESSKVPENVSEWNTFSPPEHIQFFTQAILTRLFERFGFRVVGRAHDRGGAGLKMLFRKEA